MQQGIVQKILEKPFNGKTFYSLALKGVDGFFGTGMKRPPREGTYIRFHDKTNSRGYKEVDGLIEIVPEQEAAPAESVVSGTGTSTKTSNQSGDGGKSAYWAGKEARDITNDANRELGASRNTAIALIDLALKNEVFKLPAAAKREEFLWNLLDKYTKKLMGKEEEEATKPEKEPEAAGPDVGDGDNWN